MLQRDTGSILAGRSHLFFIWDAPDAIDEGIQAGKLNVAFYNKLETLQSELLMEAAYFIAMERGVDVSRKMLERGVRVRVLTNSLASNDVLAAHAGYTKTRKDLIEIGVEIYELRPDAGAVRQRNTPADSKAGLHAKAMVFDRESVFIGSFNLDPRSAKINTEAGLDVERARNWPNRWRLSWMRARARRTAIECYSMMREIWYG